MLRSFTLRSLLALALRYGHDGSSIGVSFRSNGHSEVKEDRE